MSQEIPADAQIVVCPACDQTLLVDRGEVSDAGTKGGLSAIESVLKPGDTGVLRGVPFYVRGRVRFAWAQGLRTQLSADEQEGEYEEFLLEMDGMPVWLEQDEGEWFTRARDSIRDPLPPAERMTPGSVVTLDGERWLVTERGAAKALGVQGALDLRVMPGDVFQYFDAVADGRAISIERMGVSAWLLAGGPLDPSELQVQRG